MNALWEAASIVDNAWCKNQMVTGDGDKFCANGALLSALGYEFKLVGDHYDESRVVKDGKVHNAYDVHGNTPEVKALAEVILETVDFNEVWDNKYEGKPKPTLFSKEEWIDNVTTIDDNSQKISLIAHYNDNIAEDHDDVRAMMQKAAARLDEMA